MIYTLLVHETRRYLAFNQICDVTRPHSNRVYVLSDEDISNLSEGKTILASYY
jgi:hypothetical protein